MKLHVEMTVAYLLAAEVYEVATVTGATRGETPNENPAPRRRTGGVPGLPGRGGLIPFKGLGSIETIRGTFGSFLAQKEKPRESGAKASRRAWEAMQSAPRPPIPN